MVTWTRALWVSAVFALAVASAVETVESTDLRFRNWNTQDGLPHNRVRSVIRTSDGFVWLATDGGAVRFDGANFKTLGLAEGLPASVVLSLEQSADGTLWIGTLGGGLCAYRNGRIERVFTVADGLPSNWISEIEIDAEGRLIVNTLRGMARLQEGYFAKIANKPGPDSPVVGVLREPGGALSGLERGTYFRRWEDGQWRPDPTIGSRKIEAMTLAPDGQLWLVAEHQLWQHNKSGWTSYQIPDKGGQGPVSLAVGPEGTVWLAYNRTGLFGFENGRFITPAPTADYLPDMVESVVATGDGQVWLTSSEGLLRMARNDIRSLVVDDPSAPRVANNPGGLLETAADEFLIATQGSGFYHWKSGHATRLNEDPLLAGGVYGNILLRGRDGTIWLGSSKGLFEMPANGGEIRQYPFPNEREVPVWALAETADGLWIGSGRGQLFLLNNGAINLVRYGGGDERLPIRAIIEDGEGGLWLGTRGNGLFRMKNSEWQRLGRESGLLSEVIRTLYLDPQGRLWVGTDGGGLSLFSRQSFVSVTMANGLPLSLIHI